MSASFRVRVSECQHACSYGRDVSARCVHGDESEGAVRTKLGMVRLLTGIKENAFCKTAVSIIDILYPHN